MVFRGVNDNLKRHIATIHNAEKKFKCDDCGAAFKYHGSLTVHMARKHGSREKR
jgi:uncharacterized C2H2 Zn-finger protein